MRLLLDAHISKHVARALRERGHDVISAFEDESLRRLEDVALLDRAVSERGLLVTRDYQTLRPLVMQRLQRGQPTWGILLVPRRYPAHRDASGKLIEALDAYLRAHPEDDALRDREDWL